MHRALFTLSRLRIRGRIRRTLHGLKTLRGILFFVLSVGIICLWVGPSLAMALGGHRSDPEILRGIAPFALLGACVMMIVTSFGERAIYFTPSEVDFLLAGPFRRRELLLYKLASTTGGSLFTALFLSAFVLRGARWWLAVYVGIFLALLFIDLVSMTFVLVREMVTEYAYTRVRKIVLAIVIALMVPGVWQVLHVGAQRGVLVLLRQFRETWAGCFLLAPFEAFGRTITAETLFPEFVAWAAVALTVDLALLVVVIRLDANYLEAAVAISQKIYGRFERARRGGGVDLGTRWTARWHLPQLPWVGGAGPIAWRQLTTGLRNSRTFLILLVILAASAGPMVISLGSREGSPPEAMVWALIGIVAWMTLWFTTIVPFDFRADLDRMEWLKMLPLRSPAIVVGQLTTPVLIFTTLHITLFCGFAIFVPSWRLALSLAVIFALPYNFLVFGIQNLVFLLFPARVGGVSPGDFQAFGRQMVVFLMVISVIVACCGMAASLGGIAFWVTGQSWLAFTLVSWVVLVVLATAVVPYLAWAFERFDVSVDTPP
jgi:hypothetical protein